MVSGPDTFDCMDGLGGMTISTGGPGRTMKSQTETDVLIVGAGPTGLSLASQLLRYGVDFIIVAIK